MRMPAADGAAVLELTRVTHQGQEVRQRLPGARVRCQQHIAALLNLLECRDLERKEGVML